MRCYPVLVFRGKLIVSLILLWAGLLRAEEAEDRVEAPRFELSGGASVVDLLPLRETEVRVDVAGLLAEVVVTQVYANVGTVALEAVYVFPGSTRSAVHGLEMRVGERVTRAQIQRKAEARRTYEAARSAGQTASLLTQRRPNVFEMNLANIQPGEVVEVTLRYSEWLTAEDGELQFVYPTVVGPRYGASGGSVSAEGSGVAFALEARLAPGLAIEGVRSPTHEIGLETRGPAEALARYVGDAYGADDRDFILNVALAGDGVKSGLLLGESGGEKFFMAMLQPPRAGAARERVLREYFFVVDVSGSMRGFPLDTAKLMLVELCAALEAEDRFNLLLFAGSSQVWADRPQPATAENLAAALAFLGDFQGGGSTELLPALEQVYATRREPGYSRSVVVVTDGYVQVEEEAFEMVRHRLDEARVYAVGVGSAVNRHLIDGLARVGGGEPLYAFEPGEARKLAERFAGYVSEPVLTDIAMDFDGFEVYEVEPPALPELHAQRPLVVFGKWRGEAKGRIGVSGRSGASGYAARIDVERDGAMLEGSRALEQLWARERIRRLSDYNSLWQDAGRVEEVTLLGLKHTLLTAYTSFVAVDEVVRPSGGDPVLVTQPTALPKGMGQEFSGTGGLAVPVTPEPEIWGMALCAAAALGWAARRRRAQVGREG